MAEEIDCENGRISNFQRHMTLTLTLEQAIWHTIVHQSLASTNNQISLELEELFVDGRKDARTDRHEASFIRSTRSRP